MRRNTIAQAKAAKSSRYRRALYEMAQDHDRTRDQLAQEEAQRPPPHTRAPGRDNL